MREKAIYSAAANVRPINAANQNGMPKAAVNTTVKTTNNIGGMISRSILKMAFVRSISSLDFIAFFSVLI